MVMNSYEDMTLGEMLEISRSYDYSVSPENEVILREYILELLKEDGRGVELNGAIFNGTGWYVSTKYKGEYFCTNGGVVNKDGSRCDIEDLKKCMRGTIDWNCHRQVLGRLKDLPPIASAE